MRIKVPAALGSASAGRQAAPEQRRPAEARVCRGAAGAGNYRLAVGYERKEKRAEIWAQASKDENNSAKTLKKEGNKNVRHQVSSGKSRHCKGKY